MIQQHYRKGKLLTQPGAVPSYAWFILKGAARSYVFDDGKGIQVTTWFWHEGNIVVALDSFCRQKPTGAYIELLEDSVLQGISHEALEHTADLFPFFRQVERAMVEDYLRKLNRHYYDRSMLPAKERFKKLMQEQPRIFNRMQVKDIASFLGMFPDTLSRLRSER